MRICINLPKPILYNMYIISKNFHSIVAVIRFDRRQSWTNYLFIVHYMWCSGHMHNRILLTNIAKYRERIVY